MANRLDRFPPSIGRPPKYDWDAWLDGGVWQLFRGVDYHIETANMVPQIHRAAKLRGMVARTKCHSGSIILQAEVQE